MGLGAIVVVDGNKMVMLGLSIKPMRKGLVSVGAVRTEYELMVMESIDTHQRLITRRHLLLTSQFLGGVLSYVVRETMLVFLTGSELMLKDALDPSIFRFEAAWCCVSERDYDPSFLANCCSQVPVISGILADWLTDDQ